MKGKENFAMALSTLTARVDENDKLRFDAFCSSVGLTSSAAINMYVKAVLRERRIPFEISSPASSEITRDGAMQAFTALRAQAKNNGVEDMSLDDINKEIRLARMETEE